MAEIGKEINVLLREKRFVEADALCQKLDRRPSKNCDDWIMSASVAREKGDFHTMLVRARRARSLDGGSVIARLQEAEALIGAGQAGEVSNRLKELEAIAGDDGRLLSDIANLYTHSGHFDDAARCYGVVAALRPNDPQAVYNYATSLIALGRMEDAEQALDRVIVLRPDDYDAYYNRATLRTQTPERNHTEEIKAQLGELRDGHPGAAALNYALAKELEDISHYQESFAALKAGAAARRRRLSYDVRADVDTMADIAEVFNENHFASQAIGFDAARPIFILGLPRSGTTLVDRILSSHSKVASLGEINDFALAMTRLAGKAANKRDLVERSVRIDFEALGRSYAQSTAGRPPSAERLIDKTPANFLYIGLIARAFPNASIVHLQRNPMDSCYAIYKTLFRMGYPFSYDLDDLARYYIAYRRLMDHWRRVLPGRIIDVEYDELVENTEPAIAELLEGCGLDWEDACLSFHENRTASATASAAQVRRPIYKSSLQKWHCYENELAPLRRKLEAAGITVER